MTAGNETQPPGVKVAVYPTEHATVRYVRHEDETRLFAADVVHALDGEQQIGLVTSLPTEDLVTLMVGPDNVLTLDLGGVEHLIGALNRIEDPAAQRFLAWAKATFGTKQRRQPKGPDASRWGWQPLRKVIKQQGYSGREFVEKANALDLGDVPTFTAGNYAAWSYGGCLPQESLVVRAENLLDHDRKDLFTQEVLTNMPHRGRGKRHPKREVSSDGPKDVPGEPQGD